MIKMNKTTTIGKWKVVIEESEEPKYRFVVFQKI